MTWQTVPFGNLFEIQLGKMLDAKKNVGEPRPYLANRNVQWGECDLSSLGEMRFTDSDREKFSLRRGDLLVCEGGEVGRTAIWGGELTDCYYQKAIHRLRPKGDVDPRFVLHYMRWAAARNLFARLTSATSIAHLTKAKLQRFPLPLPPLVEQNRIAQILDAADALRAKRRDSLAQLDTLLQSTFLDMFGDPVTNPMGWQVRAFGDLAENEDGKRVPVKKADRQRMAGAFPYYGASGVIDSVDDYLFDGERLLIGEDGANLIARSTPIAFIAKGKYWVNNHAHVLAFNGTAELIFLEAMINAIDLKPYLSGTAQPKLNQRNLNRIPIATPPFDLQHRFATIVESVGQQKTQQRAHLDELDTLFASLQSRAFRGDL